MVYCVYTLLTRELILRSQKRPIQRTQTKYQIYQHQRSESPFACEKRLLQSFAPAKKIDLSRPGRSSANSEALFGQCFIKLMCFPTDE